MNISHEARSRFVCVSHSKLAVDSNIFNNHRFCYTNIVFQKEFKIKLNYNIH